MINYYYKAFVAVVPEASQPCLMSFKNISFEGIQ